MDGTAAVADVSHRLAQVEVLLHSTAHCCAVSP
jgi:hypothetical protein